MRMDIVVEGCDNSKDAKPTSEDVEMENYSGSHVELTYMGK
jgi:hypothetical protein